jgi:hypothetical protein
VSEEGDASQPFTAHTSDSVMSDATTSGIAVNSNGITAVDREGRDYAIEVAYTAMDSSIV